MFTVQISGIKHLNGDKLKCWRTIPLNKIPTYITSEWSNWKVLFRYFQYPVRLLKTKKKTQKILSLAETSSHVSLAFLWKQRKDLFLFGDLLLPFYHIVHKITLLIIHFWYTVSESCFLKKKKKKKRNVLQGINARYSNCNTRVLIIFQ